MALRSADEARALLAAIATDKEAEMLRHRWQAFELSLGGHTQAQIRTALGISRATVTRCARVLRTDAAAIVQLLLGRIRAMVL